MSDTQPGIILTQHQQRVAAARGRELGDELRELYLVRGLNIRDLAVELGVNVATAQRWLIQFGIPTRSPGRRIA